MTSPATESPPATTSTLVPLALGLLLVPSAANASKTSKFTVAEELDTLPSFTVTEKESEPEKPEAAVKVKAPVALVRVTVLPLPVVKAQTSVTAQLTPVSAMA